jgi:hypothetical protein
MDMDARLARIEEQLSWLQSYARTTNSIRLIITILLALILWRVW